MGISIGKLSNKFGLSRTALLYYDSIGLLRPSGRSKAGYRIYSDKDIDKLSKIMMYREAGMPLEDITRLVSDTEDGIAAALLKRLGELNEEIMAIKAQQDLIIKILKMKDMLLDIHALDRHRWEDILNSAGIDEKLSIKLHSDFEMNSPELHQKFLETLGLSESEIEEIRSISRNNIKKVGGGESL